MRTNNVTDEKNVVPGRTTPRQMFVAEPCMIRQTGLSLRLQRTQCEVQVRQAFKFTCKRRVETHPFPIVLHTSANEKFFFWRFRFP